MCQREREDRPCWAYNSVPCKTGLSALLWPFPIGAGIYFGRFRCPPCGAPSHQKLLNSRCQNSPGGILTYNFQVALPVLMIWFLFPGRSEFLSPDTESQGSVFNWFPCENSPKHTSCGFPFLRMSRGTQLDQKDAEFSVLAESFADVFFYQVSLRFQQRTCRHLDGSWLLMTVWSTVCTLISVRRSSSFRLPWLSSTKVCEIIHLRLAMSQSEPTEVQCRWVHWVWRRYWLCGRDHFFSMVFFSASRKTLVKSEQDRYSR